MIMTRITALSSPFLLGFDEIERALERVTKAQEGYPPYNIERLCHPDAIKITLAVAGFGKEDIEILLEERELIIRGCLKPDETPRVFIHKGIASRQFQRVFLLGEGMEISDAMLKNGLLTITMSRPTPSKTIKRIHFLYVE